MDNLRWKIWMSVCLLQMIWGNKFVGVGSCANRNWWLRKIGSLEIKIQIKDNSEPDGYERTELMLMLEEIRQHEKKLNWLVPEPGYKVIKDARSLQ